MTTLSEYEQMVRDLDPALPDTDDGFRVAVVLLASLELGPDVDAIGALTGYHLEWLSRIAMRLAVAGIWKNGMVCVEWVDDDSGGIAFWLDVCVGQGFMSRT